jgi:hypothetical protein
MYFTDEDYELIMSELFDRNIYVDNQKIESVIFVGPAYAYHLFRGMFPILNDEYDMKYDAHVVYYAFCYYYERNRIKLNLRTITRQEPNVLIKTINELDGIDSRSRIHKLKNKLV